MRPQLLEIPILPISQRDVPTTQPAGQLSRLVNGVANKFTKDGKSPGLRIEKRNAYKCLPTEVRSVVDGTEVATGGFLETANLLSALGSQIVVNSGQNPHVYAEAKQQWSKFPFVYTPRIYNTSPVYGGNVQAKAMDCAQIGGVRLYVWSEDTGSSDTQVLRMYFVDEDGTPIRGPFNGQTLINNIHAKVVSDGSVFWVVNSYGTVLNVSVWDTNGISLASATIASGLQTSFNSFDLTYCSGVVLLARSGAPTASDLADVIKLTYSAGVITQTETPLSFLVLGNAGVHWAENVSGDGNAYLITNRWDPDGANNIRAFRIGTLSATPTVTHKYGADGTGFIYSDDDPGYPVVLTGVYLGNVANTGFHVQVSYNRSDDHRMAKIVMLNMPDETTTVNVERTAYGVRAASHVYPTGGGHYAFLAYYPSAIPSVSVNITDPNSFPRVGGGNPTYFVIDVVTGSPMGRFFDGVAGNEWLLFAKDDGSFPGRGPMLFCVPHACVTTDGSIRIPIGVVGESGSTSVVDTLQEARSGVQHFSPNTVETITYNTSVAVYDIIASTKMGDASEYSDELLMPGPIGVSFTGYSFSEQGISLPPEQPTVVSQSNNGGAGITVLSKNQYVAVFEWTRTDGRRVRSAASIAIGVAMSGANNTVALQGLVMHMTTVPNLTVALYRADDSDPIYRKITNDLIPIVNDLSQVTWSFTDSVTSQQRATGEVLYSGSYGQGMLPRDPCPAHSHSIVFEGRVFVVADDWYVYYSSQETDVYPRFYNRDVMRFRPPSSDVPRRVEAMDGRIFVFCEKTIYWVQGGAWPDPAGLNGNVQQPQRVDGGMGCNGKTKLINAGIAFDSSAGGVWLLSHSLQFSQMYADTIDDLEDAEAQPGASVIGLTVNADQKIAISLSGSSTGTSLVFDQISNVWSTWTHPIQQLFASVFSGRFMFTDGFRVYVQSDTEFMDDLDRTSTAWITMQMSILFSIINYKGLKRIWRFIVSGVRNALSTVNVTATYTKDDADYSEDWSFVPENGERFENEFQPCIEEMEKMQLDISDAPADGTQDGTLGASFGVDMISFEAGTDGSLARPTGQRRR